MARFLVHMWKPHGRKDEELTEFLIQHLHERCEAVGGAGSVADDVIGVLVILLVHTNHVGRDGALSWCGDQHLLGSRLEMLTSTFPVDEYTSSLNDEVNPHLPEKITHSNTSTVRDIRTLYFK
jgi:hypothetical protein